MIVRKSLLTLALAAGLSALGASAASAEVLFWSTQGNTVEESQAMRDQVLSGFDAGADFQGSESGPWITRIEAELQAGSGKIGVLGSLHGSFISLSDGLG